MQQPLTIQQYLENEHYDGMPFSMQALKFFTPAARRIRFFNSSYLPEFIKWEEESNS